MTPHHNQHPQKAEKERLARLATECVRNASDLLEASALLSKKGFYGFAAFLAVASLEETGKAVYASQRAQGTLPAYFVDVENHVGKMQVALIMRDLRPVLFKDDMLQAQAWTALLAWIRNSDLPEVSRYLEHSSDQRAAQAAVTALAETLGRDQPWIPLYQGTAVSESPRDTPYSLSRARARGLYVDLMPGEVHTPRQIGETEFLRVYRQAAAALEAGHMSLEGDPHPEAIVDLAELLVRTVKTIPLRALWQDGQG